MQTDEELMQAVRDGSEAAFEAILARHQGGVYGFFLRMTHNSATAEDQAQEVFVRLFRNAATYCPSAKFTTYLYRIAHTVLIDWSRRASRRDKADSLDAPAPLGGSWHEMVPSHERRPEEVLQEREETARIHDAIGTLPDTHRVVFLLAVQEDMKYSDIAVAVGIPEGTVKSRFHHAVAALRDKLTRARAARPA